MKGVDTSRHKKGHRLISLGHAESTVVRVAKLSPDMKQGWVILETTAGAGLGKRPEAQQHLGLVCLPLCLLSGPEFQLIRLIRCCTTKHVPCLFLPCCSCQLWPSQSVLLCKVFRTGSWVIPRFWLASMLQAQWVSLTCVDCTVPRIPNPSLEVSSYCFFSFWAKSSCGRSLRFWILSQYLF